MSELTDFQRSLIIGSLLGDGAMRCKKNALLEMNHSYRQRSYVDWKYAMLSNLVATPPKVRASGKSGRRAYRFTTLSLPELVPVYDAFYSDGKKTVPLLQITPLALAVWFMDDGARSRTAVYLNTQQFLEEEQLRLIDMLWRQHGLRSTLNGDKAYFRIRIRTDSIPTLKCVIAHHVLPVMRYKLPE